MVFKSKNLDIKELEAKLKKSEERCEKAIKAIAPKHKGGEMEEFHAAMEERLQLQRKLSLVKGDETALLLEWEYMWDTGAPCPYVLSSAGKTLLIYHLHEMDPNWDGTYANIVDSTSDDVFPLVLVEFIGCYSFKFGGANDEVLRGHPLWNKGLEGYQAHIIENSRWIQEERKINSVHAYYNEDRWKDKKHFIFTFHDELFECITESYKIEVFRDSFLNVIKEAQRRIME